MEYNQDGDQSIVLPARLLTALEVAYRLHISRCSAYNLMQRGAIPTVHLGKSRRVRPRDLESFIQENIHSIGD